MKGGVLYRGRIAPSPTGLLHLGHARTFRIAHMRAREADGTLVLRMEDLDPQRSKREYAAAAIEDLRWLGLDWGEGPDVTAFPGGGACGPYVQSERLTLYRDAWEQLRKMGAIYPCRCSRRELAGAASAPHEAAAGVAGGEEEALYPGTCRPRAGVVSGTETRAGVNWRFRVLDGETVAFSDGSAGAQRFVAGEDFGDFPVWRRDDVPAYQLAVVADDAAMRITEVVRGADLLRSTARQILLYRALGLREPAWYHCELVTDAAGQRLAKRADGLSVRALRERGMMPEEVFRLAAGQCE